MPTQYGSRLQDTADRFRDALEAQNQDAADRMARAWSDAAQRAQLEVDRLLRKMEAARLAGTPISPAWLYQERRLATVLDTIQAEAARWTPLAQETTRAHVQRVLAQAQRDARQLSTEAARSDLPGVEASFTDINPENMANLMANTAPGGPVRDLFVRLGGEAADAAQTVLTQGVLLGKGSDWIARGLRDALDIPRHRAETIARTEAMRVYRETSRQTYAASNVVGSWTWSSALDRRTCPACVIMDGTEHPVTETLDGHPRCRCAMVPRTKGWGDILPELADLPDTRPDIPLGKDWLAGQSEAVQRAMLGPGKFSAWKAGDITLDDMVARTHSPEWGTMRRERSMVEIREGRNPNTMTPVR